MGQKLHSVELGDRQQNCHYHDEDSDIGGNCKEWPLGSQFRETFWLKYRLNPTRFAELTVTNSPYPEREREDGAENEACAAYWPQSVP